MGFLTAAAADTEDITAADLFNKYAERLDKSMPAQPKEKSEEAEKNSLAVRVLLLKLLEKEGVITEKGSLPEIVKTSSGKPYFRDLPGLHFGFSHTKGRALAVLSDSPCGCDIERVRPMKEEILKKLLSPDEMIFMRSVKEETGGESEQESDSCFFTLWTRKESLVKACGSGFATRPDRVNVCDGEGQLIPSVMWEGDCYRFAETDTLPGYAVSLCFRDNGCNLTEKQKIQRLFSTLPVLVLR